MSNASEHLKSYRALEHRLINLRQQTGGRYSSDEVEITDSMVEAWENLSTEEQDLIYSEGAKVPEPPTDNPSSRTGIASATIFFWSWRKRIRQYSRPVFIEHGAQIEQEPVCS